MEHFEHRGLYTMHRPIDCVHPIDTGHIPITSHSILYLLFIKYV